MELIEVNTIIIGASAAGLACAACLQKKGIPFAILEQYPHVGHAWRNHYDRLHLNTEKAFSSLPYLKFPDNLETYVPRDQVIAYLEDYAARFRLNPLFNQQVLSARHDGKRWMVTTRDKQYVSQHCIVATGFNRKPFIPAYEGMNETKIPVIHSSAYKNGSNYGGKNVLVVGFGNSACEISLCLHEYGAKPALSVKGAVNIVPRNSTNGKLNHFMQSLAWVTKLVPSLIDAINAPSLHARYGDYTTYGLKKLPYGPNVQIVKHKRVPLLDIGTFKLIKSGDIKVYPAIKKFNKLSVSFNDGTEIGFDAVIMGTGYRSSVSDFLPQARTVTDAEGSPVRSGKESSLPGLYFCGFYPSPAGMLNEIGKEAKKIASAISKKATRL